MANQWGVDILKENALLKHDIGCELALTHAPEVALPKSFLDSVKKRVERFGEAIQMAAEFSWIKFVC